MYTSSDNNDEGYYDISISRRLYGTGLVNQQDFTIHDSINIGLSPKHKSEGHCWFLSFGLSVRPFRLSLHKDHSRKYIVICRQRNSSHLHQSSRFWTIPYEDSCNQITPFTKKFRWHTWNRGGNHLYSWNIIHEPPTSWSKNFCQNLWYHGTSIQPTGFYGATFSTFHDFLDDFHGCSDLYDWRARQQ